MSDSRTVTLVVKDANGGDAWGEHLYVDGDPVATNRTLGSDEVQAQRDLADEYLSWFETRGLPIREKDTLAAIGEQLFETWLADDWDDLESALMPPGRSRFVVASDVPAVLNLPWSLLRLPGRDEPLGLDPLSSVRLHPMAEQLTMDSGERRPGPLRVLYSACAPRDAGDLGYEKEEYQLLQTLTQPGHDVEHFGCDLGRFDELQDRVREYNPHVVHLTGHGVVDDGKAHFAFEDEKGNSDLRPGNQIVRDALVGRGVQCVFVSGCETGQAPEIQATNGLCQELVLSGVSLSVGWAASILDEVAIKFGDTFYAELSAGEDVDRAVVQARRDARALCRERVEDDGFVDASWTLPVLYTAGMQTDLFDPDRHEARPKPSVTQDPLPGMTEGHADYFIGRRREQQRLLPKLRSGDLNTVLLTGLGGVGKSTLATRLTRRLQQDGFVPIAVPTSDDEPLTAGQLIDRCFNVFLGEDADGPYPQLRSEEIGLRDKLRLLVRILNQNRFTLVLDNFEQNVDRASREILDDTLAWFLPYLVENLTGGGRCLVTSRYRPADLGDDLPSVATELSLTDFPESAFFKYLLDDETVEERYRSGELSHDLLSRVYDLLGGTPRFLEQVREALGDLPVDKLEDALDGVDLPAEADADENRLRAIRDEYVQDLFVDQLYAAIDPPEARTALSRAAVYTTPVTAEGFAVAADADEGTVRNWLDEWRRRTFIAPVQSDDANGELWVIPPLLRLWLLDQMDEDERRAAHAAAGEWLDGLREADREEEHLGAHFLTVDAEARSRFLDAENHERAREITSRMSGILDRHALYDEVARLNEEMLVHDPHPSSRNWLGQVYLERAEYEDARTELEKVLQSVQEIGDLFGEATARHNLATITLNQGNYGKARAEFEEVLRVRQEIGDRSGEATTRQQLATIAAEQGDYEKARSKFEEAQRTYQEIEDRRGEVGTRHNLATIAAEQGDYEEARSELEEALQIRQEIGDRSGEAKTRHNLATIALLERRDIEEARAGFEKALEIFREIGDRSWEATTRHQLATIALNHGDYEEARAKFEKALEIFREIGDRAGEAKTRHQLASIMLNQGGYEEARSGFEEALRIRQEIGDRSGEATTFGQLGNVANELGDTEHALRFYLHAFLIHREIGHRHQETARNHVNALASELEMSQEEFDGILQEADGSYDENRGWGLIQEAFPDADHPDDVPPSVDSE